MNFNEYQDGCFRTANRGLSEKDCQLNWATGLAGETGEYCELIKKHYFHGKPLDRESIKKELGDILWYLTSAATTNGFSLEEIAQTNLDKLKARYPDKFTLGGGIRNEGA